MSTQYDGLFSGRSDDRGAPQTGPVRSAATSARRAAPISPTPARRRNPAPSPSNTAAPRTLDKRTVLRKLGPQLRVVVSDVLVDSAAAHAEVQCIDYTGARLVRDALRQAGFQAAVTARPERVAVTLLDGPPPRGRG